MKKLIIAFQNFNGRIDKYIERKIEEDWRIEPAMFLTMLILTYILPHYIENTKALATLILFPASYATTSIGLNKTIIPNEKTRKKAILIVRLILMATWTIAMIS